MSRPARGRPLSQSPAHGARGMFWGGAGAVGGRRRRRSAAGGACNAAGRCPTTGCRPLARAAIRARENAQKTPQKAQNAQIPGFRQRSSAIPGGPRARWRAPDMQAAATRSMGSPPHRAGQARSGAAAARAAPPAPRTQPGRGRGARAAAGVSDVFVLDFDGAAGRGPRPGAAGRAPSTPAGGGARARAAAPRAARPCTSPCPVPPRPAQRRPRFPPPSHPSLPPPTRVNLNFLPPKASWWTASPRSACRRTPRRGTRGRRSSGA
jgi:hypothetical protein